MYSMSGPVKTDAIVLRSLRYGEADRILHLYTPERGRIGAIAKGVRRTRSRFGGRLEPFSRVRLVCHEGRGELLTITAAETLDAHARLRDHAATLDSAARACDAVARVFETEEPHLAVYNLLANELALLAADATNATHANALAFRLKLLVSAGLPRRSAPARRAARPSTWSAIRRRPAASCATRARPPRFRSPARPTSS
jgi:DNA repair protein RecO (recombination protein O)